MAATLGCLLLFVVGSAALAHHGVCRSFPVAWQRPAAMLGHRSPATHRHRQVAMLTREDAESNERLVEALFGEVPDELAEV